MNSYRPSLLVLSLAALPFWGWAQDNPSDNVPESHWAFEAYRSLSGRILFGYPDGAFRGSRPLTRYEFAVATAALLKEFAGRTDELERAISESIERQSRKGGTQELELLRQAMQALAARTQATAKDLDDLRRLVAEFEKELASLGVEVDKIKKDLAGLEERVRRLEGLKDPIQIKVEANILAQGGFSRDNLAGITPVGTLTGVGRGSYAGRPVGLNRDLTVLHEGVLELSSEVRDLKFKAVLGYGNTLSSFRGMNAQPLGPLAEGGSSLYVNELTGSWTYRRFRGKGEITVGRFGQQAGAYILQRPDTTPFFSNSRWDNGDYLVDGGKVDIDWDTVKLTAFAGRTGAVTATDGTILTRPTISVTNKLFLPVEQVLGFAGRIDLVKGAYVRGAYIYSDSNNRNIQIPGKIVSKMISLGGSLHLNLGDASIDAGIAKPIYKHGAGTTIDNDNEAFYAGASYRIAGGSLGLGYRSVEAFSNNNGDWGRFGIVQNPTGFSAVYGSADLPLGSVRLKARAEFAEGKGTVGTAGMRQQDKASIWMAEASLPVSQTWTVFGGYESARWDFAAGADPSQAWVTLGARAKWDRVGLTVGGQLSDADGKGRQFLADLGAGGKFKGGAFFSQLSFAF